MKLLIAIAGAAVLVTAAQAQEYPAEWTALTDMSREALRASAQKGCGARLEDCGVAQRRTINNLLFSWNHESTRESDREFLLNAIKRNTDETGTDWFNVSTNYAAARQIASWEDGRIPRPQSTAVEQEMPWSTYCWTHMSKNGRHLYSGCTGY